MIIKALPHAKPEVLRKAIKPLLASMLDVAKVGNLVYTLKVLDKELLVVIIPSQLLLVSDVSVTYLFRMKLPMPQKRAINPWLSSP